MFGEKNFELKNEIYTNGFRALNVPGAMMLWNKIYKHSFLDDNGFKMLENARCYNDECFNSVVIPKAKCVVCISNKFYNYRKKRAGSIQTSANAKQKVENTLIYARYVCDNWRKNDYIKNYGVWLLKKLTFMINRSIRKLEPWDKHYYAQALMKIAKNDLYNKENTKRLRDFEKTLLSDWITEALT